MTALRSGDEFFVRAISVFTFLTLACHFSVPRGVRGNPVEKCVDKRHNFIVAGSDPKGEPFQQLYGYVKILD